LDAADVVEQCHDELQKLMPPKTGRAEGKLGNTTTSSKSEDHV
jgi:hypothetical protein